MIVSHLPQVTPTMRLITSRLPGSALKVAKDRVKQRLDYILVRAIAPISVTVPNSFTFQPRDGTGTNQHFDHYP